MKKGKKYVNGKNQRKEVFKLNDEIFKTKMRNYYDTVFRTCMAYLQNSHDAEDITEEVWITYYYKSPYSENESLEKS